MSIAALTENVVESPIDLGIEDMETLEAPDFWGGFIVGAGLGAATGTAIGAGIVFT